MAEWVLVENNEIIEYHDKLPRNWKNYSGLYLSESDTVFLKSLGWYKVQKQNPTQSGRLLRYDYVIENDYVLETAIYEPVDFQHESLMLSLSLQNHINIIRGFRNSRLKESDWTQLPDVIENQNAAEKQAWKIYRQALRDMPSLITVIGEEPWPVFENILAEIQSNSVEENIVVTETDDKSNSVEENIVVTEMDDQSNSDNLQS